MEIGSTCFSLPLHRCSILARIEAPSTKGAFPGPISHTIRLPIRLRAFSFGGDPPEDKKPATHNPKSSPKPDLGQVFLKLRGEISKFMAPRDKGDIRDVILMGISFAVFVYIAQEFVCAYYQFTRMSRGH